MKKTSKLRCQHCGQWRRHGDCVTLDDQVDNYGDYCICFECAIKYPIEYWAEWEKTYRKKLENDCEGVCEFCKFKGKSIQVDNDRYEHYTCMKEK